MFYRVIRRIFLILSPVIMPVKVYGRENINREGKYIIACNHQSYMDIPSLIIACRRQIFFMAKATLFRHRILGYLFKKMGAFPVNTGTSDIDSLKHAIKVLREEKVLGIFPQGTRVQDSPLIRREDILSGVALIALKTGADIVPCVFERRPLLFRINRLHVGKPIELKQYAGRRVNSGLLDELCDRLYSAMDEIMPQKIKEKYKDCGAKVMPPDGGDAAGKNDAETERDA